MICMEKCMKEHSVERLVLPINFILICGIALSTFAGLTQVASLLFAATYALLLLGVVAQTVNRRVLPPSLICVIACGIFCLLHTTISIARATGGAALSSVATFVLSILFFSFATHMSQNERLADILMWIGGALSALFLVGYFVFDPAYMGTSLTMGFYNPNITGMFLMHACLYNLLAVLRAKRWYLRVLSAVLAGAAIYLILQTRCRSALLGLAAFAVLAVLFLLLRPRRIPIWLVVTVIVTPLVFAVLYLLANEAGLLELIGLLEDEGKTTTSRVEVWQEAFAIIREHLFTGDYAALYAPEVGIGQRHNIHVEILTAYGLIPFLLFIGAMFFCLVPLSEEADTPTKQLPLLAFFALLLAGTFEAGFITGALGLYVLSGGFLAIAAISGDDEAKEGAP